MLSGGSEPADSVNAAAIEAMREMGIDISEASPQRWTDETLQAIWGAVPALEEMRARLRRRFEHADEPAHVFTAQDDR